MKAWSLSLVLAAMPTASWAQAVTFADLQGAVIEASVTYQQERRTERGEI
jgi:hypothetical protein